LGFLFNQDLGDVGIHYADLMRKRAHEISKNATKHDGMYYVNDQLCFAINNIELVAQEIKPIAEKIGMNNIIEKLAVENRKGSVGSIQFNISLTTAVMESANENIDNKVFGILDQIGMNVSSKLLPQKQNLFQCKLGIFHILFYIIFQ